MSYPSWDMIRNGTFVRTRNFPLIDADMPTFMGQPHAVTTKDLEGADVVIIGAPYVASWQEYAGVAKSEWIAGPKRVRQQSIRYPTGYIQDLDVDVLEHLKIVDYGDAAIPPEVFDRPTVDNILRA
jgi:agmatinase